MSDPSESLVGRLASFQVNVPPSGGANGSAQASGAEGGKGNVSPRPAGAASTMTVQGIVFAVEPDLGVVALVQPADTTTTVLNLAHVTEVNVEERAASGSSNVHSKYYCANAAQELPSPDYNQLRQRLDQATRDRQLPSSACPIATFELLLMLTKHFRHLRWGTAQDAAAAAPGGTVAWPMIVVLDEIYVQGPWDGRAPPVVTSSSTPPSEQSGADVVNRVRMIVQKWYTQNTASEAPGAPTAATGSDNTNTTATAAK